MSIPTNSYLIPTVSADPAHPTKAFDSRNGGIHAAVGPAGACWVENPNTSGVLYYFCPPLHGPSLLLDVNDAPPTSAYWGVLTPGARKLIKCGSNVIQLILVVGDGTATQAIVEPLAKV